METIYCPAQLDDAGAARYINEFWRAKHLADLQLDFSTLRFAYPGGALILALGVRDLLQQRYELGLRTSVSGHTNPGSASSYLMYFGFFEFIGVQVEGQVIATSGNRRFLPITRIGHEEFQASGVPLQEQITSRSAQLGAVLYPLEMDISRVDMLTFCLREIVRNVFEHSQAQQCFLMAQRWANGIAEITIADEGVGIPYSLSQAHQVTSARSALRLALQPGISRVTDPLRDDKWQNSGFGLYVVSEIGKTLGNFSILSNGVMLTRYQYGDEWLATPSQGTVVKLRANTNDAEYFPNVLQTIVERGEEIAKQIPGARPTASKGSRSIDSIQW